VNRFINFLCLLFATSFLPNKIFVLSTFEIWWVTLYFGFLLLLLSLRDNNPVLMFILQYQVFIMCRSKVTHLCLGGNRPNQFRGMRVKNFFCSILGEDISCVVKRRRKDNLQNIIFYPFSDKVLACIYMFGPLTVAMVVGKIDSSNIVTLDVDKKLQLNSQFFQKILCKDHFLRDFRCCIVLCLN
jgi:hypothetical protein